MTAIKGPVVDRTGVRAPSKRGLSSAGSSERNLSSAKQHFMDAVREGVDKLMRRCGYSRERATRTILHELSCGDIPVNDDEIYHMMKTQGVGIEDAEKALTVSKAVLRAMKNNGLSAVQAIDDLTSRLNIVSLLRVKRTPQSEEAVGAQHEAAESKLETQRLRHQSKPSGTLNTDRSQKKLTQVSRKFAKPKNKVGAEAKGNKKPPFLKMSRKRSISSSDETSRKNRARADSVSEEVNAKIAQSCDTVSSDQSIATIPAGPRGKLAHHDTPVSSSQPPLKRQRAEL